MTYVENTHCWPVLAQLHLSMKCSILSSMVTRDTRQTIQNLLSSRHECFRTGALVPSSVHLLIPFAAVLFRCSPSFPELSVCGRNPCSLSSLMLVSMNTEDICKVVQENPSLKKNWEQWAGSVKFSENGEVEVYTRVPEHPRAAW